MNGRRSKVLRAVALLPLLAASVLPTQIRSLVCRVTGVAMELETCCPSELEEKTPPVPHLIGENCCVVKMAHLPRLVSAPLTDGMPPNPAPPIAVGDLSAGLVFLSRVAPAFPIRPPPLGPPLFVVKRSFLI
jgi:hypothetical protein